MKKKLLVITLLLISVFYAHCKPANNESSSDTSKSIQNSGLTMKIKSGAMIVDVRTPAEYAGGHYDGAINIPMSEIQERITEFGPKNKPVIVYCAVGSRSGAAKRFLEQAGYTDVMNGVNQANLNSAK